MSDSPVASHGFAAVHFPSAELLFADSEAIVVFADERQHTLTGAHAVALVSLINPNDSGMGVQPRMTEASGT